MLIESPELFSYHSSGDNFPRLMKGVAQDPGTLDRSDRSSVTAQPRGPEPAPALVLFYRPSDTLRMLAGHHAWSVSNQLGPTSDIQTSAGIGGPTSPTGSPRHGSPGRLAFLEIVAPCDHPHLRTAVTQLLALAPPVGVAGPGAGIVASLGGDLQASRPVDRRIASN